MIIPLTLPYVSAAGEDCSLVTFKSFANYTAFLNPKTEISRPLLFFNGV